MYNRKNFKINFKLVIYFCVMKKAMMTNNKILLPLKMKIFLKLSKFSNPI